MKKFLCATLALIMCLGLFAGCTPTDDSTPSDKADTDLSGTYNISMWVSEKEGVSNLFKTQIEAFMAANPGIIINANIEGVTESEAASKVIQDVASAPDLFCFAQDQLARLVQAAALAKPGKAAQQVISSSNDAGSVTASKVAGDIYAYPMTSDNGYYMYYDTSLITEEDAKDLATLVSICEKNNKKFRFGAEDSWYTASFFFATGCVHEWTTNSAGEFTSVNDTFNSAAGITAMKGMQILTQSPAYDNDNNIFTDAAIVVTGTWNDSAAQAHFGQNLGVTKLPSFTVDGQTYQMGSFSGYKMMGVKPQKDAKTAAVLQLLAQYLTNEECQLARFNSFGWGPSNVAAQGNSAVKANAALSALAAQNAFAVPQGQIAGVYWDNAKLLAAASKAATTDADLQKALDDYTNALNAFTSLTPEQRAAFTIIGGVKGTMWDTDFEMNQDPEGTWTSVDAFDLTAGTEFKVRQGMGWKVAYGNNVDNADTSIPLTDKGNYVVETAGKFYIQLVLGENDTAVINLIPAE